MEKLTFCVEEECSQLSSQMGMHVREKKKTGSWLSQPDHSSKPCDHWLNGHSHSHKQIRINHTKLAQIHQSWSACFSPPQETTANGESPWELDNFPLKDSTNKSDACMTDTVPCRYMRCAPFQSTLTALTFWLHSLWGPLCGHYSLWILSDKMKIKGKWLFCGHRPIESMSRTVIHVTETWVHPIFPECKVLFGSCFLFHGEGGPFPSSTKVNNNL